MELLNNLWEKENGDMRHIVSSLSKAKIKRHIENYKNYFLKFINTDEVNISLDWGSGGGLLSKELLLFSNEVHCVDVSQHSIENCIKYASPTKTYLLKDSPSALKLPKVDLVLANAIVWHFPTLKYFEEVISKWVTLSPKYILFNTKRSKTTRETSNYKKDILQALHHNDDDVINLLKTKGYDLVSNIISKNTRVPLTYFVFKKS